MKGKVYFYTIIGFLLLIIASGWESIDSNLVLLIIFSTIFLSPIISMMGIIKTIKYWEYNNKVLNVLFIVIDLLLVISSVMWFAVLFNGIFVSHDPRIYNPDDHIIINNFYKLYRKVIPPFLNKYYRL